MRISAEQIKKANEEFRKAQSILQNPNKKVMLARKPAPSRAKGNPTVHIFRNMETGKEFTGTVYQLRTTYDLPPSSVSMLVKGRCKMVGVWEYVGMAEDQPSTISDWDPSKYKVPNPVKYIFRHEDGRVVIATQHEFGEEYKLNSGNLCSVIKGRRGTIHGWSCDGVYEGD